MAADTTSSAASSPARRWITGRLGLALIWLGLALIVAIGIACTAGDESTPVPSTATPPSLIPTNTPAGDAAPTKAPGTVTPTPAPTNTPVSEAIPASNIPFPTSTPSPTATPTPGPAFDLTNDARRALDNFTGFAFEMNVSVEVDGKDITLTYAGEGLFNYTTATLSVAGLDETFDKKIIVADRNYVFDESNFSWAVLENAPPFLALANPSVLFGFSPEQLSDTEAFGQLSLVGTEMLDGVDNHVISVRLDVDRTDAVGVLDVAYWLGVEDDQLRQVQAEGDFNLAGLSELVGSVEAETATALVTVKFFDHGKGVDIVTPRLLTSRFGHKAILLDDGRVLVAGGYTGVANNNFISPEPVPVVQTFEFETATWGLAGSFDGRSAPGPGTYASTIMLADGRIMGIGIFEEGEDVFGSRVILEKDADFWTSLPTQPLARGAPEMVLLDDGRVLVTGGFMTPGPFGPGFALGTTVEIYDPATGEWTEAPSMNETHEYQAVVRMRDGRALALGGRALNFDPSSRAEIYDPDANEWTLTGSMNAPLSFPVTIALLDGRVLVTGVSDLNADDPDPISEVYDPNSGTWERSGPMRHVRNFHSLTLLPDGRVLAIGGEDPGGERNAPHATTEVFDPETDTWSPGPDLAEPRYDHSATLLPDGRVFLAGGIGVDPLQLVETRHALRVPHFLGCRHERSGQPVPRRRGSASRNRSAVRTRRGWRRCMAMPSQEAASSRPCSRSLPASRVLSPLRMGASVRNSSPRVNTTSSVTA